MNSIWITHIWSNIHLLLLLSATPSSHPAIKFTDIYLRCLDDVKLVHISITQQQAISTHHVWVWMDTDIHLSATLTSNPNFIQANKVKQVLCYERSAVLFSISLPQIVFPHSLSPLSCSSLSSSLTLGEDSQA